MIDLTKTIIHSLYAGLSPAQSGYVDFDVSGTYSPASVASSQTVATNIDVSNQYVMVFVTEEREAGANYTLAPDVLGVTINRAGSPVLAGYDISYRVDSSGNLKIELYYDGFDYTTPGVLPPGSYTILNSDLPRAIYYVFDM